MQTAIATPVPRKRMTVALFVAVLIAAILALPVFAQAEEAKLWTMNGTGYDTLAEAVWATDQNATTATTITLNESAEVAGTKFNCQNVIIDLNGYTLTINGELVGSTGTETNAFQLLKGSTVTFKNGTIKAGTSSICFQNYCDLTLENVTVDASEAANCSYAVSNNNGSCNIIGSTSIIARAGKQAFDLYYWPKNGYTNGQTVTVDTTGTISGIIEYGSDGSATGLANIGEKSVLVIKNGTFDGTISTYSLGSCTPNITISGGTFKFDPATYTSTGSVINTLADGTYKVAQAQVSNGTITVEKSDVEDAATNVVVTVEKKDLASETLVVDSPTSTLTLDAKAVEAIKSVAKDDSVIKIEIAEKTELTEAQQAIIASSDAAEATQLLAIDASVLVDGTSVVWNGTDSSITISVPKSSVAGTPDVVLYVPDADGEIEQLPVTDEGDAWSFTTTHLSTYVFASTATEEVATSVSMYRMYNPNSGEHFYTASLAEKANLVSAGWKYEGIAWKAPVTSSTPVYRLYSGTDHFYTISEAEKNILVKAGWKYEGIGWYSDDAKGVEILREFNPNVDPTAARNNSGSHNYTTSVTEHANLISVGWIGEGVAWYGLAE